LVTSKKVKCENHAAKRVHEGNQTDSKNEYLKTENIRFLYRMSLPSTFNGIQLYKSLLIKNPLSSINGFDAWLDAISCEGELSTKTVN